MDFGSIDVIRDLLFRLPFLHIVVGVFLVACAIGGAAVLLCIAIRSAPEAFRDIRAARSVRKALID